MVQDSDETLRQYLDRRERALVDRIDQVRRDVLAPLEADLADVRKAKSAIVERQEPTPPVRRVLSHDMFADIPEKVVGPYERLTLKELVINALREQFRNGATANQLIEFFRDAWDREVERASLSPQLSRLKVEKKINLTGKVWTLAAPETNEAAAS